MRIAMSIGSLLLLAPNVASAEPSPSNFIPIASERLEACIIYNAVKADDGGAAISDLIAAARIKCTVQLGMWRFFVREHSKQTNADQASADAKSVMAEAAIFDDIESRLTPVIMAGRKTLE